MSSHRRKANRIAPIVSAVCEYRYASTRTVRSLGICEKAIASLPGRNARADCLSAHLTVKGLREPGKLDIQVTQVYKQPAGTGYELAPVATRDKSARRAGRAPRFMLSTMVIALLKVRLH